MYIFISDEIDNWLHVYTPDASRGAVLIARVLGL